MLVLRRRLGEEIVINERMRIRVLETSNGGCRLAFDAPDTDRIRRAELPPREEDILQQTAASMELL
jgi:carbon storage regulator CsrA